MPTHHFDRTAQDVHRALSQIISELKDPRITGLVSIVKVDVSTDLSYAKIYVSTMEGSENTKNAVKGLKAASGFVRRELAARVKLRHTPALTFIADDSIEYGAQINEKLNQIKEK